MHQGTFSKIRVILHIKFSNAIPVKSSLSNPPFNQQC